jgi:hypothetical protein
LDAWDVSNVVDMSYMFAFTADFNQPLNSLDAWDVSNVVYMYEIYATAFNQLLNSWKVLHVKSMEAMSNNAHVFNQPWNPWSLDAVVEIDRMFKGAERFNQSLLSWDLSNNVSRAKDMFLYATGFKFKD